MTPEERAAEISAACVSNPDLGWDGLEKIVSAAIRAAEAAARAEGWRAGAEAMREAVEQVCRNPRVAPLTLGSILGGDTIPFVAREHLADAIAALPIPEMPNSRDGAP